MKELTKEQVEYAVGRLQRLAEFRKFSQTQLEQMSGVNQSTISKIFSRAQDPSLEVLKKLFQAVGLKLGDVLNETDGLAHELFGYLATPLTAVVRDEKAEAELRDVVERIKAEATSSEFVDPHFDLYWPGDHTHPTRNPEFTPGQVYLTDRSRASTHDFIILFCGSPSYGVGQENEIATQAGIPAIRLVPTVMSRMMSGSFIKAIDITYTGSLSGGISFSLEELRKALREIRCVYFRYGALYKGMNGNGFGERLRKLVDDRSGDYQKFAADLGIGLSYLHALMEEPFTVSNPSIRLLKRMAVLLGESVAYVVGESQETDPIWVASNACWHAWVTQTPNLDAAAAVVMRDQWREGYRFERSKQSTASFRKSNRAMRESDWDKLYRQSAKKVSSVGEGQLFQ